ncbi:hypothetical protein CEXT_190371 [Caerostris extrusa]|uniref:Uncharacterized protein n=1 Tax=Caerostris extrusa TaxID=172846 RepID=A0AAV4M597_CAEEX|nr:hypothetical protein CEXT_190371 [Caerostris extrusa]
MACLQPEIGVFLILCRARDQTNSSYSSSVSEHSKRTFNWDNAVRCEHSKFEVNKSKALKSEHKKRKERSSS